MGPGGKHRDDKSSGPATRTGSTKGKPVPKLASASPAPVSPCTSCGACCAFDASWPRFWTDSDDALALIPPNLVNEDATGMACDGDRCQALVGIVGEVTQCSIYAVRPEVCHACLPGDEACSMAREAWGLEPLDTSEEE